MKKRKRAYAQRKLTNEERPFALTYLGHVMLWFQDKESIMPHITSSKFVLSYDHYYLMN
jgi:hypothetical protein